MAHSLAPRTIGPLPAPLEGLLEHAVLHGAAPGVVAVVRAGDDLVGGTSGGVKLDTLFRIASMTKAVTAVSILQLVEEGTIDLDQPVADILPEFGELRVLMGFQGDDPVLRPATRRATIRQLLSHTAGLAYEAWHEDLSAYHRITGAPTLAVGSREGFAAPLVCEPGTRFDYSTSVDWAGLIVEAVAGKPLQAYWRERILDPLGMADTVVELTVERRTRTMPVHVRVDGEWQPTEIDLPQSPEVYAGGHCLYSTAPDFLRFQSALMHNGASNGIRILSLESVSEMFSDQLGELKIEVWKSFDPATTEDVDLGGAARWGLGLQVDPVGRPGGRSPDSGGWAGLFNTFYWVDRRAQIAAGLYTQTLPFHDPATVELATSFERTVYDIFGP